MNAKTMKYYRCKKPFQIHKGPLLPVGTLVKNYDGQMVYNGIFMCLTRSEHSHECLVGDDDKKWRKRSALIDQVNHLILAEDVKGELSGETWLELKEDRLQGLWDFEISMKYCRGGTIETDSFLWNDAFYCADIQDLERIRNMLKKIQPYR